MPSAKTAVAFATLVLLMPGQFAAAQPVPLAAPIAAPPAWTVAPDAARGIVQLRSTAKGGAALFLGGCGRRAEAGLIGNFSRYRGTGLRTDGAVERVLFYVRGEEWQEVFSAQLRYSIDGGYWQIVKALPPVFVNSFSRGATLAVVNGERQEVFAFDLTGSTGAARVMRSVCGFP